MKRAGRLGWLAAAGGLVALALTGCPEPRVTIVVALPEQAQRERLTVELSVFAPAAELAVGCDDLAFGDVDLGDLRSARVHYQRLLAPDGAGSVITTSVPRSGRKIALALAAYDYASSEIELGEAMFAGCLELGMIEGDQPRVELSMLSTVAVDVENRPDLFLSAQLDGTGPAIIQVARRTSDGSLVATAPNGIPVALVDCCGNQVTTTVRYSVEDPAGQQLSVRTLGPEPPIAGDLAIERCGPFQVVMRARFQRGMCLPLTGIAYRLAFDSEAGDVDLRTAAWVLPAQVSDLAGVARHGFVLGSAGAAGGSRFVAVDGSQLTLVAQPAGQPPMPLGPITLNRGGQQQHQLLLVLPPDGTHPNGAIVMAPAAQPLPALDLETGLGPSSPIVSLASCERGDLAPPLLLGMKTVSGPPSAADATQPISHYWFVDVDTSSGLSLVRLAGSDWTLIDPQPVALTQSFCVDKAGAGGTVTRRLLAIGEPRHGLTLLALPGDQDADSTTIAHAAQLAAAGRGLIIDGLVERSALLPHFDKQVRGALAAVWFDQQLEVNYYRLIDAGGGEQLAFDSNRLRVGMVDQPIGAMIATGHFTPPTIGESSGVELAVIVIHVSAAERAIGELYLGSSSGELQPGRLALTLTTASCNQPTSFCELGREVQLLAADVDGDAYEELLVTSYEGSNQDARRRARVIDLSP